MSHRPLVALAVAAVFLLAVVAASHAQAPRPAPFVGQWHWNRAESTSLVTDMAPQDVVLSIAAAEPARVQWTLTALDGKGGAHLQSYDGRGDGSAAQVAGSPDGAMAAFTVTPTSFRGVYSNRDGSTERTSCTLAAGGGKMTCDGTEIDAKGRTRSYIDVYDRR